MRKPNPRPLVLVVLFVASIFGCDSRNPPRQTIAAGNLASRLEAAKGIHDVEERDKALAKVALDAADAGDSTIAD